MTDTCYCVKGRIGLCGACLAALGESRAVSAEERFKAIICTVCEGTGKIGRPWPAGSGEQLCPACRGQSCSCCGCWMEAPGLCAGCWTHQRDGLSCDQQLGDET